MTGKIELDPLVEEKRCDRSPCAISLYVQKHIHSFLMLQQWLLPPTLIFRYTMDPLPDERSYCKELEDFPTTWVFCKTAGCLPLIIEQRVGAQGGR